MERKPQKNPVSIDGFIPRQPVNRAGAEQLSTAKKIAAPVLRPRAEVFATNKKISRVDADKNKMKQDLAETLGDLDLNDNDINDLKDRTDKANRDAIKAKKDKKWQKRLDKANEKRRKKGKKALTLKQLKRGRIIHRILIGLVLLLLGAAAVGYLYGKTLICKITPDTCNVFSIFDIVKHDRLKEDKNGRTNILIFGTEADNWDGADLTDSIMVMSIDQDGGNAYMVSLPRDLYVKHDCMQYSAMGTSAGKLNETYLCAKEADKLAKSDDATKEKAGAEALENAVSEITGLDIQYYVHANWDAVIGIVNAIGGIDIDVTSDDPRGIYDIETGLNLKLGHTHMDGQLALTYSRARNSAGGYGLPNSNFDRELHQQEVIRAIQEKALNSGTLSNPGTIIDILGTLGDNLRMSFSISEVQTLATIGKDLKDMITIPLVDAENNIYYVKTGNIGGASVVLPSAGQYLYGDIQEYIHDTIFSAKDGEQKGIDDVRITVLNGSGIAGKAGELKNTLNNQGYNVSLTDNAPNGKYAKYEVYLKSADSKDVATQLAEYLDTSIESDVPSNLKNFNGDIIVVIGE